MQPDDQFQAASITKMVTAATLMTLVEQGRGELDAGIGRYLAPSVTSGLHEFGGRSSGPEITPWQLLSHTSGMADFFGDGGTGPSGLLPFVARMLEQHGQMWDPLEIVAWTRENLRPALSTRRGLALGRRAGRMHPITELARKERSASGSGDRQQRGPREMQQHGPRGRKGSRMPGWPSCTKRVVTALSVLVMPLAGTGCGETVMASGDRSAMSQGNPRGLAAGAGSEVCLVGQPTEEGVECQALRADGRLYTLIGDLGGLAGDDEVCVCGQPVEISTCMQGTTITVTRIGPPDTCR